MPINATRLKYDALAILPDGSTAGLTDAVSGFAWEENGGELAQRGSLTVKDEASARGYLREILGLGAKVVFLADQGAGFEAVLFGTALTVDFDDSGMATLPITVYDDLFFTKGDSQRYIEAGTLASTALQAIFSEFEIPANVTGPNVALPVLTLDGSIKDQIAQILAHAYYAPAEEGGGQAYMVQARYTPNGTIVDVIEPGLNVPVYHFHGFNTASIRDSHDATGIVTEVHVVGEQGEQMMPDDPVEGQDIEVRPVIDEIIRHPDPAWARFRLRRLVKGSALDTPERIREAATDILAEHGAPKRTRIVRTVDVPKLRRGHLAKFSVGTLDGYYVVTGVQHDPMTKTMTMAIDSSGLIEHRRKQIAKEKAGLVVDESPDVTRNLPGGSGTSGGSTQSVGGGLLEIQQ